MDHVQSYPGSGSTNFLRAVYAWMFFGMILSAASAFFVYLNADIFQFALDIYVILAIVEVGLVVVLSWLINRIPSSLAALLYIVYCLVSGVTLLAIVYSFEPVSVGVIFLVTAGIFGAMSLYGYTTKRDLTGIGMIAIMLLFGVIIALLINIFLNSSLVDFIASILGVFIFTALTAYDVQRIKKIGESYGWDSKYAIIGALSLYLDFINLFISLLNLFGERRRD